MLEARGDIPGAIQLAGSIFSIAGAGTAKRLGLGLGALVVLCAILPVTLSDRQVELYDSYKSYGLHPIPGVILFVVSLILMLQPNFRKRVLVALIIVSGILSEWSVRRVSVRVRHASEAFAGRPSSGCASGSVAATAFRVNTASIRTIPTRSTRRRLSNSTPSVTVM